MASSDAVGGNAIFYAELLTAKVIEGINGFPNLGYVERRAMIELVAAKLTELANEGEDTHARG